MSSNLNPVGISAIQTRLSENVFQNAAAPARNPRTIVFGTAEKGFTSRPTYVNRQNLFQMLQTYGRNGDMLEQITEGFEKGEDEILVWRIGASPTSLIHVGGTSTSTAAPLLDGLLIKSLEGGKQWETQLGIAYRTSDARLIISDKSFEPELVVFDNDPEFPLDLALVTVLGSASAGNGSNIGEITTTSFTTIPFSSATSSDADMVFLPGADGTDGLSRIELWAECFKGLQKSKGFFARYYAAPERASLNAPFSTSLTISGNPGTAFPARNATNDKLMKTYIEYVDGEFELYFDGDNDGVAEFWTVADTGNYSATSKGGKVFTATDFSEPNFAYLYGYQMYLNAVEQFISQAVIPVEPPAHGKPLSEWLGTSPTYSTDLDGDVTVTVNGSGLLGHKYIAGATDWRAANPQGGMILTDAPYFDNGVEVKDDQDQPIDLGKYVTLLGIEEIFIPRFNLRKNRPYRKISPTAYLGWKNQLGAITPPTNKPYRLLGSNLFRLTNTDLNSLKNIRVTMIRFDAVTGPKVLDGPTMALPISPFRRQGTMEIVSLVNAGLRRAADPFIGRFLNPQEQAALQKELDEVIMAMKAERVIIGAADFAKLIVTEETKRTGTAFVQVGITIPFELERIIYTMSVTIG